MPRWRSWVTGLHTGCPQHWGDFCLGEVGVAPREEGETADCRSAACLPPAHAWHCCSFSEQSPFFTCPSSDGTLGLRLQFLFFLPLSLGDVSHTCFAQLLLAGLPILSSSPHVSLPLGPSPPICHKHLKFNTSKALLLCHPRALPQFPPVQRHPVKKGDIIPESFPPPSAGVQASGQSRSAVRVKA